MTLLEQAIERNRARGEAKRNPVLKPYTFHVMVIPTVLEQKLFGTQVYEEDKVYYETSRADAKRRAGI